MAVMLPTVIKNLFSRPETRLYPTEVREVFPNARGHIEFDVGKCSFCTLCAKRCPAEAITVDRANKTWTLDPYRCITCSACVEGCAKNAITMKESWRTPAYSITQETYEAPAEETLAS